MCSCWGPHFPLCTLVLCRTLAQHPASADGVLGEQLSEVCLGSRVVCIRADANTSPADTHNLGIISANDHLQCVCNQHHS